jgi:predicted DNA-binding protein with PD1-like motif
LARLVVESKRSRRIVAQLGRGDELAAAIIGICKEHQVRCATVTATGALELLELADPVRPEGPRALHGPAHLLRAGGTIAERGGKLDLCLTVVAAHEQEGRLELVGGICTEATVVACELVIEAFDDLILRRGVDDATGQIMLQEGISLAAAPSPQPAASPAPSPAPTRAPASKPAGQQPRHARSPRKAGPAQPEPAQPGPAQPGPTSAKPIPAKPKPGKPSWADAVMASVRAASEAPKVEEEEFEEGVYRPLRVGDILDHNKFGRCVVQRVDADQEYATVRLRNNRLVRLNLEVLRLRFEGEEDGHQVFNAAPQAS